ncbi:MAG: patatin-like phospholipase family protein [Rhodospirillales bacterium]|nr:patatin-like phospholipase family protein [Alphaproteobacteria bacterium]MCB9986052.1 patatin-like phospholipase family protein [Rhodospirillales bacterium]USO08636.1 MAG: patatin-like phospholipase family protein [Rhodospirillales bacterium]
MRGLIPAHLMAAIEERTGLGMAQMVDLFTGPSTGAILNAALTRPHRRRPSEPQYKARHMIRFYEREGESIFPRDRFRELRGLLHDFNNRTMKISTLSRLVRHGHYNERNLANALYALYGDAKLGDSVTSLIVPCYSLGGENAPDDPSAHAVAETGAALHAGAAVWLKHIRAPAFNPAGHKPYDVTLYDAVMASAAAPTYFPCHDFSAYDPNDGSWRAIHAIDGSIFDNPCISWHGAIKQHVPPESQPVMICLGTGITNRPIHKDEWNRFGSLGVVDPANHLPLINIFFHASESALMDGFGRDMGRNLYLFNGSLVAHAGMNELPSMDIDDATPENMTRLARFAQILIEDNKAAFEEMCHILVSNRDRRQAQKTEQTDIIKSIRRKVRALRGKPAE